MASQPSYTDISPGRPFHWIKPPLSQAVCCGLFLIDLLEHRKNQWSDLSSTNTTTSALHAQNECAHFLEVSSRPKNGGNDQGILSNDARD